MESGHPVDHLSKTCSDLQEKIQFSRLLTVVCLLVCAAGMGLLFWTVTLSDDMPLSVSKSRDLERIASRMLGFESRLPELSSFEQMLYRLGEQDGETQEQIRLWYEEIIDDQSSPLDGLYLGIVYGEAGLTDQLSQLVTDWDRERTPRPLFRRLLEAGYLSGETSSADYDLFQARLAEEVPTSWFYFRLAERLADQAGNSVLQVNLQSQLHQLTDLPLWKWRLLMACEMGLIGIGLVLLLRFGLGHLTGRVPQRNPRSPENRVPWTFGEGTAVLARGGALTIVSMLLVAVIPGGLGILEDYGFIFLYLPSVILISLLVCRPRQCPFLQVVGCSNVWQRLRTSLPLVFMVVALGFIGDWLILIGGDAFQSSVHWTEWFVPQVVWGSRMELVKTGMEFVLLAPLFEELIFRGILFTTIRTKFSFPISMAASALVFALVHGYGLIAFLTVLWSGCLWAWSYERSGSVIPGVLAHAVNNGMVVGSLVAFFR